MTSGRRGCIVSEGVEDGWGTPIVRSKEAGAFHLHLKTSSRLIRLPKAGHQTNLNEGQKFGSRTDALSDRLWVIEATSQR